MTHVFVFGNPNVEMDSMPIQLIPKLREKFPRVVFTVLDPNEEWETHDPFIIIDTIVGLPDIHVFHGLDEFEAAPTVSMHDFDALFNLRYLAKLGKIKRIIIIGVSPVMNDNEALLGVTTKLKEILPSLDEVPRAQ